MYPLIEKFYEIFGYQKSLLSYFSPGRVNLIGEHIDYNGGLVFPAAIHLGTYGVFSLREDTLFRFFSMNFAHEGIITISLDDLTFQKEHGWANYVKGIIFEFKKRGFNVDRGFDLLIYGTLPTASGLSSSASIELLIAYALNDLFDFKLSRQYLALLSQHVENHYMGMHCGIMDQLVIAEGKKNRALLMNTATLEIEDVPARFSGYEWVIMNTNYPRKTTDSKYNERRKECQIALEIAQKHYPIQYLCDMTSTQIEKIKSSFPNEVIYRRAVHAVTEQERTLASKAAMEKQDANEFARLLDLSHLSLKNDYEVTGFHLDTLVETARLYGAIGARVTGAGFGGCAIALVPEEKVKNFSEFVGKSYKEQTGIKADFYYVTFENGVHAL